MPEKNKVRDGKSEFIPTPSVSGILGEEFVGQMKLSAYRLAKETHWLKLPGFQLHCYKATQLPMI